MKAHFDRLQRFETLSARMMRLQGIAKSLWHEGRELEALKVADTIKKVADVRLQYIPY